MNLRCSSEFKKSLEDNAAELGISVTSLIQQCVNNTEINYYRGLDELVPVMRKHGNNLNQIARHLNSGGHLTPEFMQMIEDYRWTVERLYEMVSEHKKGG